ncbi:amino acid kinase family protein [Nocardioides nematodiphilus]|uniref:amino acid kinase family protein n=1 Tax=Nocardioides nematodiphilus TaxID=2849669 RepID=UPI001CDA2582|nr:carbamate kinase [Nocardioides nematodiphilus]MCA1984757.1 carbamate kinase [Nocardioides nematodiphilus]
MRIVVAIGGNALLERGEVPDASTQRKRLAAAAPALRALAAEHELVLVHGNGPQVGLLAVESASDPSLTRPYPLADLVAESQGLIGSWLQQDLGAAGTIATLVTQIVVDEHDPAFSQPTKFIGASYDERDARRISGRHGWEMRRDGTVWRRVVASPRPVRVVELPAAGALLKAGVAVVMAGGGGVPVVARDDGWATVDAVIDKDFAAGLIAHELDADRLVILTDVEGLMSDYGTPRQRLVASARHQDLADYRAPAGSMGPKVEAAALFVAGRPGRGAAVGALADAEAVAAGRAGTQVH